MSIPESAYQKGRQEAAKVVLHDTLLRLGEKKLGTPTFLTRVEVLAVSVLERSRRMCDRLLDVTSWTELTQTL